MEPLARPKAIAFDWDGTLADSLDLVLECHNHVRTRAGLASWTHHDMHKETRYESARVLFPRLYGDNAVAYEQIYYDYVDAHHLDHVKPLPGAEDLLSALSDQGIPMVVVSNKRHRVIHAEVSHFGWQDFFRSVTGAGEAANDKPDPEHLHHALKAAHLKTQIEDIWFVGDGDSDMRLAAEAGCISILIGDMAQDVTRDLQKRFHPRHVVADCRSLMNLLLCT